MEDPDNRKKHIFYQHKRRGIVGFSRDDLEALIVQQDGKCAICGDPSDQLEIDHDHKTGKVRGLLCGSCNRGIGQLRDDPEILQKALEYIQSEVLKYDT